MTNALYSFTHGRAIFRWWSVFSCLASLARSLVHETADARVLYRYGTSGSNVSPVMPETGVTRYYEFTVSRKHMAPDGYAKNMLVVNGQFPGPTLEANWGDTVEVLVKNDISGPAEGTGLHWHGLLQQATPWFDGVPSIQQCPIAPGSNLTYRFKADLYGTSWYHSHYSAQYSGGLFGPMVIHGPKHVDYDIDLGPVILSDHYHKDYHDIVHELNGVDRSKWLQYSDNNLINGQTVHSGVDNRTRAANSSAVTTFAFQRGRSHRMRLINSGSAGQQVFSIDQHELTVIANDFVPIKPYTTKTVFLGVGQRTDVVVHGTGEADGAYWARSNISTICNLPRQPQALAVVRYGANNSSQPPTTRPWPYTDNGKCNNDDLSLTVPYYPITPDANPALTYEVVIDDVVNASGHHEWRMNYQAFRGNLSRPLLLLAQAKKKSFAPERNVLPTGANQTVRLIVNNNGTISHPMHLHGHNMYVLHEGDGFWDGHSVTNPQNPQRRDTQMLRPSGHMVIQYDAVNPGVWPFHCHIAWHLSLGLAMNVLERPADIAGLKIPSTLYDNCASWDRYRHSGGDDL